MATYSQVGRGSKGSDVTELQKLLNSNGYALDVDGSFGPKTQAAVKDYQQKNGLKVDGIVGNNTWGSLTKANTPAAAPTTPTTQAATPTKPATAPWSYDPFKESSETAAANSNRQALSGQKPGDFSYGAYQKSDAVSQAEAMLQQQLANKPGDFSYGAYEKSDAVKQAEAMLQQQLANKPGAYQSQWQAALDDTMNKILNREKFSYDLNGDALYQQYKDQYVMQGKQAMMDTMGQAAAMTGGYGNSYAQTAGQQTYQGYLQQLNDRVPELYQMALDQYNREGDNLYNQYGMYADRENQDYGRYRDTVSDYYTETDRLTNDARYQGEQDYGKYMDAYNMAYGQHRDTVSDYYTEMDRLTNDARYQAETEYGKYMDAYNMAYGQHRDTVSDWQQEQARADENYWNLYDRDYNQYANDRNLSYQQNRDHVSDAQWDQSFLYQQGRDKLSDEQWQKEFDEAKRQYDQQYALAKGKSASSSGSPTRDTTGDTTGDAPTGSNGYDNGSVSEANIKALQAALLLPVNGEWGPQSKAAAGGLSADEAWEAYFNGTLEGAERLNEGYIKKFMNSIVPESQYDAVMMDQYGSYKQYVAQQIENSDLSKAEKAYLINEYTITEADLDYKPKKNQTSSSNGTSGPSSLNSTRLSMMKQ